MAQVPESHIFETIPFDDETIADHIAKATRELNGHLEEARKKGLVVQISMLAYESVPALRLDAVYKRLDKPLILRV